MENFEKLYGKNRMFELEKLTADAGYGSEENYELLMQKNITPFVKYNTFDKEQNAHYQAKHKTFSEENLHYNEEEDFYACPMGQKMEKTYESIRKPRPDILKSYRIIRQKTAKDAQYKALVSQLQKEPEHRAEPPFGAIQRKNPRTVEQ